MGFKKDIKGLDESEIKIFVKKSIINGSSDKIVKSKSLKKSEYLQQIVLEATNEIGDLIESLKETFESPEDVLKYLNKSLKK